MLGFAACYKAARLCNCRIGHPTGVAEVLGSTAICGEDFHYESTIRSPDDTVLGDTGWIGGVTGHQGLLNCQINVCRAPPATGHIADLPSPYVW